VDQKILRGEKAGLSGLFLGDGDEKGFLKVDIANDGLHPNAKGYELIKPLAENAIKTALKMKRPNDVDGRMIGGCLFNPSGFSQYELPRRFSPGLEVDQVRL
jgi:hypothetical protein